MKENNIQTRKAKIKEKYIISGMKKDIIESQEKMSEKAKQLIQQKQNKGITLVALVVTTIFSYDENVKSSNNKGFLLQTI